MRAACKQQAHRSAGACRDALTSPVRPAGRPVYLDMTVKVKQNWRKDEQLVSTYGA